jgi:hypothetical protein
MKPNLIHSNPISPKNDETALFPMIYIFYRGVSIAPENDNHKSDYAKFNRFGQQKQA